MGRRGSRLGPSGGQSDPVERSFESRQGAGTTRVGWTRGRGGLGSSGTSMLWDDPCWGQTLPRNHSRPAAQAAASRRGRSQGDPPLLAPQVPAGDNSVLFGQLRPPRLPLLSRKRGRGLPQRAAGAAGCLPRAPWPRAGSGQRCPRLEAAA